MTYAGEGLLQYARADLGRPGCYISGARTAERCHDFSGFEQLEPLFDHLEDMKNVEMLMWGINQGDAVRVGQELKNKVAALNGPANLDPVTKTTKTCRYVEAAFLWRVKTTATPVLVSVVALHRSRLLHRQPGGHHALEPAPHPPGLDVKELRNLHGVACGEERVEPRRNGHGPARPAAAPWAP